MPGRCLPCSPSVSWRVSKRRSGPEHRRQGKQRRVHRVRGHGGRFTGAGVLNMSNAVTALTQEPAPLTLYTENPRVTKKPRIELQRPVKDSNLIRAKQLQAAETTNRPAAAASNLFRLTRGGKPNSNSIRHMLCVAKRKLHPIPSRVPQTSYWRPLHPHDDDDDDDDVGKVSHVNICPVCEKYTVTEFDLSSADSTVPCSSSIDDETTTTTLRARFKCGLCREVFDLGVALFDPRRGIQAGVVTSTSFDGEDDDRLRPPVAPPRGKYPCPRCWKNTHTSFQCMTSYFREESKRPSEPACPEERLNPSSWEEQPEEKPEEKSEARNIIRTVLGFF